MAFEVNVSGSAMGQRGRPLTVMKSVFLLVKSRFARFWCSGSAVQASGYDAVFCIPVTMASVLLLFEASPLVPASSQCLCVPLCGVISGHLDGLSLLNCRALDCCCVLHCVTVSTADKLLQSAEFLLSGGHLFVASSATPIATAVLFIHPVNPAFSGPDLLADAIGGAVVGIGPVVVVLCHRVSGFGVVVG